ncbi:MAG: GNAT family N-acetyltransferase [Desulfobacterales bacterium]|nr:GNAT family N-acetyltransferase [Desulfobacterales bacterium]
MESIDILIDDLSNPKVIEFLNDHLRHMVEITPPGCVHALDVEALKKPEITFWTVWERSVLVCCGALKELNATHAELKSMRTAPSHLGKGIASRLLEHILTEAKKKGYQRISLETGSYDAFTPARNLYEKFGFKYGKPFSDYNENPNSVFMTKDL